MLDLVNTVYQTLSNHLSELQMQRKATESPLDRLEIDAEMRGIQTALNVVFQAKQAYDASLEDTHEMPKIKVDKNIEDKGKK